MIHCQDEVREHGCHFLSRIARSPCALSPRHQDREHTLTAAALKILQQKARGVIMLGEQIGEETGKVIVRRVVAGEGRPKVEVSVQSNGKLLGVETRGMVTYTAPVRADGSVYGEGQGIVTGKNGETAMMRVAGAGRLSSGAVSYRGAAYFESESEKWKRLNTIAVVYEYEADADGNARSKSWEWK